MSEEVSTGAQMIEWNNFVKFVRQLSHDLRNQLNAAELQAALINELTTAPELKPEVARLRELVAKLGRSVQQLSASVALPTPIRIEYSAHGLLNDLQQKIAQDFPEQSQRVKWELSATGAMLDIDPGLVGWALLELFDNAFRHDAGGAVLARGKSANSRFTFELREHKNAAVAPAKWNELLSVVRHGHYGLGLKRARAIIAAHGGNLTSEWDPHSCTLISQVTLPCSTESN